METHAKPCGDIEAINNQPEHSKCFDDDGRLKRTGRGQHYITYLFFFLNNYYFDFSFHISLIKKMTVCPLNNSKFSNTPIKNINLFLMHSKYWIFACVSLEQHFFCMFQFSLPPFQMNRGVISKAIMNLFGKIISVVLYLFFIFFYWFRFQLCFLYFQNFNFISKNLIFLSRLIWWNISRCVASILEK